jgi:hypothetical protein
LTPTKLVPKFGLKTFPKFGLKTKFWEKEREWDQLRFLGMGPKAPFIFLSRTKIAFSFARLFNDISFSNRDFVCIDEFYKKIKSILSPSGNLHSNEFTTSEVCNTFAIKYKSNSDLEVSCSEFDSFAFCTSGKRGEELPFRYLAERMPNCPIWKHFNKLEVDFLEKKLNTLAGSLNFLKSIYQKI